MANKIEGITLGTMGARFRLSAKTIENLRVLKSLLAEKKRLHVEHMKKVYRADESYHRPEEVEVEICEKSGKAIMFCDTCSEHQNEEVG